MHCDYRHNEMPQSSTRSRQQRLTAMKPSACMPSVHCEKRRCRSLINRRRRMCCERDFGDFSWRWCDVQPWRQHLATNLQELIAPLLRMLHTTDLADVHLRHSIRIALRDQLLNDDWFRTMAADAKVGMDRLVPGGFQSGGENTSGRGICRGQHPVSRCFSTHTVSGLPASSRLLMFLRKPQKESLPRFASDSLAIVNFNVGY